MRLTQTEQEFVVVLKRCKEVFLAKLAEYGPSWRYLRLISLADKIYAKAKRIRKLQQLDGQGKVPEGQDVEFVGIANYCVIGLVLSEKRKLLSNEELFEASFEDWNDSQYAASTLDGFVEKAMELLSRKNHDYDEAWREMEIETITDEILLRTCRIKQLVRNNAANVLEDVDSQLYDTLNYAVFALIKLSNS